MNEKRKAIIEIIEPYMAKDLSEGCLVNVLENIGEKHGISKILEEECGKYRIANCKTWLTNGIHFKIIGHYDITAVLKFICDSTRDFIGDSRYDCGLEVIDIYTKLKTEQIPNKPLSLYTEQEEKDLLELLLKLKC